MSIKSVQSSRSRSKILVLVGSVIGLLMLAPSASASQTLISFVDPSPAEGASVGVDVRFAFTIDRTAKSVKSLSCDLSGPTAQSSPCDAVIDIDRKLSASGVSYAGLAAGTYTLTVTAMSGGGIDPVSRTFTVDPIHTVSVTVSNGILNRIGIVSTQPDPGELVCLSQSTCSREMADGAYVRVELGDSSPFTYVCDGADPVPAADESGSGIFIGTCEATTLTSDYAVSVVISVV
jgi:hypothetical protein